MTNAELIAKIKAEIERLQKENINYDENGVFASYCDFSAWSALDSMLTFVSGLEESEKPINLEEEIKKEMVKLPFFIRGKDQIAFARHFAKWGAEHAKIDVTDFCKPIDPGIAQCIADHSWEMLGEDEKPVPNDLEEAARRYGFEEYVRRCNGGEYGTSEDAFIAGAKWQAEQLLKSSPLPEDTVLFNKGVEEGKRLAEEELSDLLTIAHLQGADQMKEQMMKIITKDDNLEEAGTQYVKTHFRDIDWTPDVIKLCLEEAFISGGEYVFKKIKYE